MNKKSMLARIAFCGLVWASSLSAQNAPKPMTNSDVIAMVKAGLPETTIISAIDAQNTNFDNSAVALIDLSKAGVGSKIMDAMIAASRKQTAVPADTQPTAATTAAPAGQQFVSPTPAPSQPTTAPQNQGKGAAQGAPAQGGFFGRLGQVQTQLNGAVKDTQGTIQQGQTSVKQIEGKQTGKAGTPTTPQAKPNAQPAAAVPTAAAPAAAVNAAAATAQQQQANRQKIQSQMNACRQQAAAIDPQLRSAEAQKALTSCIQSVNQSNTPAAAK